MGPEKQPPLVAHKAAVAAGLKRYFTGVPCPAGHVCERYVSAKRCVICTAEQQERYRAKNLDRVRVNRRAADAKNRDARNRQASTWRKNNPEKVKASLRRWHAKNQATQSTYRKDHNEQRNESNARRRRERLATDPLYALQTVARASLGAAFRRAGYTKRAKTAQVIGCSWPELKRHIEKQFLPGMTWLNRGAVWHVDHILPLSQATSPEEVIALCHFTNLRPLWALENHKKHAKRQHLL